MKNLILLLALLTLITHTITGQITLDSMSYPETEVGTDSLRVTAAASAFPSLAPLAGGSWDLSAVTDSTPVFFAYRVPTTSGYQFADSNLYSFAGFAYQGNIASSILSGGVFEYGLNVPRTPYTITSITTGLTDSFIIQMQNIMYTNPRIKLGFPTTIGTSWLSSYHADLDFQLTYLMGGDTLSPGIVRTYTNEKDSVVGWGKMRIRDASGSPSAFLDVLQVQTLITRVDSFFLNGTAFSPTMLTFFSVTQGQTDTIYEQNYYRPEEVTALAEVEFRDAAYTQPYKATTHVQNLLNVGVPQVANKAIVTIYPNPVCDHIVYAELPAGNGLWTYELTDVTGRKVANDNVAGNTNTAFINLPAQLAPGIYYLKLLSNNRQFSVTPIEIDK